MRQAATARWINIIVLVAAIAVYLFHPLKRFIWYDETVSVWCAKGITYDTKTQFGQATEISSRQISQLNDHHHVLAATIADNSNSYLYNMGLHYFTYLTGNHLNNYFMYSRLCGIAALIALFLLCRQLWGNSWHTSAAVILLMTDMVFWGMSNEIRTYAMGAFFVTLAGLYYFRYRDRHRSSDLLWFGLSCCGALICHYFAIYAIAIPVLALLINERNKLLNKNNLYAILIPFGIIIAYVIVAYEGFLPKHMHTMILNNKDAQTFSIAEVGRLFMKHTAMNFKMVITRAKDSLAIVSIAFLFIILVYVYGIKSLKNNKKEKNTIHLLFTSGISAGIFLMALSIKNHTYAPFYYRYFIFSLPFCSVFVVAACKSIAENANKAIGYSVLLLLTGSTVGMWLKEHNKLDSKGNYNHYLIAEKIVKDHVTRVSVPDWDDALLLNCFLPNDYLVTYALHTDKQTFILTHDNTTEEVPVLHNED